jgi:16S rRNA (guanine966-N2)-methyltransferase
MRAQLRIVAGSLRGRKLTCTVGPDLRPTPDRVRQALFSILGNAVPDRPFVDIFAGTGVVGLEALSRGASTTTFVERDFRLVEELHRHVRDFGVAGEAIVEKADVYRWVQTWHAPPEPVTVFVSPPFGDFQRRKDDLAQLAALVQEKTAAGSVLALQGEHGAPLEQLPDRAAWDERRYGRNVLLFWVKEEAAAVTPRAPEMPP